MDTLKILPLGGLGEIGINAMLLEYGDSMVLIDCGIQFPDASYPGVELFAPDMSYVRARAEKLKGVVITHGHEDHIGAIPYLCRDVDKLDVYCSGFPRGLLTHKLEEHGLLGDVTFHDVKPREKFTLGCFTFDPIPVQHSIIEALGYAIETPVGNIVHSGDFKHDPNPIHGKVIDFEPFREWGDKGVQLLFSDSTNAENTGHSMAENDIVKSFEKIFERQTGRIFIALFASNVRRVEKLLSLAHERGKKVALVGRSMHLYSKLAHQSDMLDIPAKTLVSVEELGKYDDKDIIILCTGSQAEPMSALVRMAYGRHKDVKIHDRDLILLSSRFIPGNERNITDMINQLCRLGAEVIYESIHEIHVSGHGFQDELKLMLNATRPKFFVPVHGEYRHLSKHARLAEETGVAPSNINVVEDGQMILMTKDKVELGDNLPLQRSVIVQGETMDASPEVFSERMGMSKAGIVFCTIFKDKRGEMLGAPAVESYGLMFKRGLEYTKAHKDVVALLKRIYPKIKKANDIEDLIRIEVRRFFKTRSMYKPIVLTRVEQA